ncbi:MAG: TFIIB-type zinc ribbon-containing protein [Defluviitaleaceae bacterium]|nr:TFIIB-type zinc ribbon-containing protein [Defluviitaleaceae bacterium]
MNKKRKSVAAATLKEGQKDCPNCASTDMTLNLETQNLRCNVCLSEFAPQKFNKTVKNVATLNETIIGEGAAEIMEADDVLTFECHGCGAEVIVDTSESLQSRCHWCRNFLSVNHKIPNGAVPDKLLPFNKTREEAQEEIAKFVEARKFFAHPKFKKEFTAENVMGVYLPYMVVDINSKASFKGQGERLVSEYEKGDTTYYDADLYNVTCKFDMTVENLTIESNIEKLRHASNNSTNNIVNAIKPFDLKNSVQWNAHFMRGFTSQKRDVDVDDLTSLVETKIQDIARHQAREELDYDRGLCWEEESLDIKGSQWKAAYLPVWLYSYKHKDVIHYVAVNGRSLSTMGSIPINWARLWMLTLLVGVVSGALALLITFTLHEAGLLLFLIAPCFFWYFQSKYRNKDARYSHESHADTNVNNLQRTSKLVKRISETQDKKIENRNDSEVNYKGESLFTAVHEKFGRQQAEHKTSRLRLLRRLLFCLPALFSLWISWDIFFYAEDNYGVIMFAVIGVILLLMSVICIRRFKASTFANGFIYSSGFKRVELSFDDVEKIVVQGEKNIGGCLNIILSFFFVPIFIWAVMVGFEDKRRAVIHKKDGTVLKLQKLRDENYHEFIDNLSKTFKQKNVASTRF